MPHHTSSTQMLVYLWGLNQVRTYNVNTGAGTAALVATYNLRHDPTPANVAAGRRIFFDAAHSFKRNLSCATCHVEGGSDFLLWSLSNLPLEDKGPMFTQTLVGLKRLAPFHWRGERQFSNFKPAFVGLLGATPDDLDGVPEPGEEPTAADFALFEDFVFSLTNPANPSQNRERLVDAAIHHPGTTMVGNAIDGQGQFQDPANVAVGRHSCVDCHAFPTGTINDINVEADGIATARRISEKPAPFHEVWRKHQTIVQVIKDGVTFERAFLGAGISHSGILPDLFRFVNGITDSGAGQQASNVTDFVHQWDQGLGLAAHYAYLLNAANANSGTTTQELAVYLHGEMDKGNCDIAVIGMSKPPAGALKHLRWTWDRTAAAYVCEDPTIPNRALGAFQTGAANNLEANVFLGLPRGMAERFAIDYDMDGVRNLDPTENVQSYMYNDVRPGFDNQIPPALAMPPGTQPVLWLTSKVARLVFTTNEPTRATIDYAEPATTVQHAVNPLLSRYHSVLLTGLRPSTHLKDALDINSSVETLYFPEDVLYSVTIHLTDATGNTVTTPTFTLTPDPFIVPAELELPGGTPDDAERKNMRAHVVDEICMGGANCDELTFENEKWRVDIDFTIAYKRGLWQVPQGGSSYERVRVKNRVVFGRVLIERADGTRETASSAGLRVQSVDSVDNCRVRDNVRIIFNNGASDNDIEGVPAPVGQYVAGRIPSDVNGKTAISFYVDPDSVFGPSDNLMTGDRILFNVEGVLELDTSVLNATRPIDDTLVNDTVMGYWVRWGRGSPNQWSFPDTMEAGASVRSREL